VPATQVRPVPTVDGSAVFESHLVRPVIVDPDTPVNDIHSFVLQDFKNKRPAVTVGTVATVMVVSPAASLAASVVTKPLSNVAAIIMLLDY